MEDYYDKLIDKYPFLTVIDYNGEVYCGVISVYNNNNFSMYVISEMNSEKILISFLDICEKWWIFTDRKNISIFLNDKSEIYKRYLKYFNSNYIKNIKGRIPENQNNKIGKKKIVSIFGSKN